MSRPHLAPLSNRAVSLMLHVREISGGHHWPSTTHGKQPFVISSPTHAIADWIDSKRAVVDGVRVRSFSPRELRRTCTQLMQRRDVDNRLSDLLQRPSQAVVLSKHYRNNPEAALPEKRRAIDLFEHGSVVALGEIKEGGGNVLSMLRRKKKPLGPKSLGPS